MAHTVVKIFSDMHGEKRDKADLVWHLSINQGGDNNTLCEGEFYGLGAGTTDYMIKHVEKGGVTCKNCLDYIRIIKDVKL